MVPSLGRSFRDDRATLQLACLGTGKETVDSKGQGAERSLALGDFKAIFKAVQICYLSLVEGKSNTACYLIAHP